MPTVVYGDILQSWSSISYDGGGIAHVRRLGS
jgi:hypothetical protein